MKLTKTEMEIKLREVFKQETFGNVIDIMKDEEYKDGDIIKCYFDRLMYDTNIEVQNGRGLSKLAKHTWTDFSRELRKGKTKCEICGKEIGSDLRYLESHEYLGLRKVGNELVMYILDVKCLCGKCHKLQHFRFVNAMIDNGSFDESIVEEQYKHYQNVTGDYESDMEVLMYIPLIRNKMIENVIPEVAYYNSENLKVCLLDSYDGVDTFKMKKYLYDNDLLYVENQEDLD